MSSGNITEYYLTTSLSDVAAVTEALVVVPEDSVLTTVRSVTYGAVNGDAVLTITYGGGNVTAGTAGTLTIAVATAAEGDVDELANLRVHLKKGSWIKIVSDGGGSAATIAGITYTLRR